jgi:hypothetical protein
MSRDTICMFSVLLVVGFAPELHGATFNIANADVAGLINAINTANGNHERDIINLAAAGTYTLTGVNNTTHGNNGLPVITNDISGFDLIIHGNGASLKRNTASRTPAFRILQVASGAGVFIDNLTIASGAAAAGAGLLNVQGLVALRNCAFNGNSTMGAVGANGDAGHQDGYPGETVYGGAIDNLGGSVTANFCTFDRNAVTGGQGGNYYSGGMGAGGTGGDGLGGAIGSSNGIISATACRFTNNSAVGGHSGLNMGDGARGGNGSGGAVYSADNVETLTACTFSNNRAVGGLSFLNNSQYYGQGVGGAMTANEASNGGKLVSCSFASNSATYGGAIENNGSLTVTNCTLAGNTAKTSGGAFDTFGDTTSVLTIVNCTLSGNVSTENLYGGISRSGFQNTSYVSFANTIFYRGLAHGGAVGPGVSKGHNISDDSAGGDDGTGPGAQLNAVGDMRNTDPALDPNGLQDNGGSPQTIALQPNSPAVDHGDDAKAPQRDERGYLRNGPSDIGAFEYAGRLLGLSGASFDDSAFTVVLEVVAGKTYHLERKLELMNSWDSTDTPDLVAGANDTESLTDLSAPTFPHEFYHVTVMP